VPISIGTVVAAIVGYLCIKYFIMFLSRYTLVCFAYYCWFIGIIMAIFFYYNPAIYVK